MSVLAVIPVRIGSKGIYEKNLKEIAGKPLFIWMAEAARATKLLDRVVVSTDSADMLVLADRMGIETTARSLATTGDMAPSELAVLEACKYKDHSDGIVLLLQATSPLTLPEDIEGTLAALNEPAGMKGTLQYDCALSVTPFDKFLWWDMGVDKGVTGINHDKSERQMRQQRHGQFLENGAVYAMRTEGFLKAKHRFFGWINTYVMPKERSIEIDDMADFTMAEALLRERQRQTEQVTNAHL